MAQLDESKGEESVDNDAEVKLLHRTEARDLAQGGAIVDAGEYERLGWVQRRHAAVLDQYAGDEVAGDAALSKGLLEAPLEVLGRAAKCRVGLESAQGLETLPALPQIAVCERGFGAAQNLAGVRRHLTGGHRHRMKEAALNAAGDELCDMEYREPAGEGDPFEVFLTVDLRKDQELLGGEPGWGLPVASHRDGRRPTKDRGQLVLPLAAPQAFGDQPVEGYPKRERPINGQDVLREALRCDGNEEEIEERLFGLGRHDLVECLVVDEPHALHNLTERCAEPLVEVQRIGELLFADEPPPDCKVTEPLPGVRTGDTCQISVQEV